MRNTRTVSLPKVLYRLSTSVCQFSLKSSNDRFWLHFHSAYKHSRKEHCTHWTTIPQTLLTLSGPQFLIQDTPFLLFFSSPSVKALIFLGRCCLLTCLAIYLHSSLIFFSSGYIQGEINKNHYTNISFLRNEYKSLPHPL